MVPVLASVVLDYHRAPLRHADLNDPGRSLPEAFGSQLLELGTGLSPARLELTADTLGVAPGELEAAALFFLRHVLLAPGADHYRVLGVAHDATKATIRSHYRLLVRLFHPDRAHRDIELHASCTARINQAYDTLSASGPRHAYDRTQARQDAEPAVTIPRAAPRKASRAAPRAPRRTFHLPHPWKIAGIVLIIGGIAGLLLTGLRLDQTALVASPDLLHRTGSGPEFLAQQSTARTPAQEAPPDARRRPDPVTTVAVDTDPDTTNQAPAATVGTALPGREDADQPPSGHDEGLMTRAASIARVGTTKSTTTDHDSSATSSADAIIERLTRFYRGGDLDRLMALFAANAELNDLNGSDAIRAHYRSVFERSTSRDMRVGRVDWKRGPRHRISGFGIVQFSDKITLAAPKRRTSGRIKFELVAWLREYRITKLIQPQGME